MSKKRLLLLVFAVFAFSSCAYAQTSTIRASALPQETAVLAALDDAHQLEPYCRSWTLPSNWHYPIPKDEVAARMGKDLGFLTLAAKNHPDNTELQLLIGLVARFAYNLDVDGSFDAAIGALGQAEKLSPSDVRAPWFRSTLQCQTMELKTGADGFLAMESSHVWNSLPADFWYDYINCATIANLPAHTLRAIDHYEKLYPGEPSDWSTAVDIAHNRVLPFDPQKDYETKDSWNVDQEGNDTVLTSTLCGIRLRVHDHWQVGRLDVTHGSCVAIFTTGPYEAVTRTMHPSVMVLVQQAADKGTLEEYSRKLTFHGSFEPFAPSRCPSQSCIALKGVQPGVYAAEGDGRPRLVFFARDEPDFPGLIFETPHELPKPDAGQGMQYYRPSQTQQRMPRTLYYVVSLDTASSIEEPALKDFDFFLQNLTVE
jgi:hypothetical protein